MKTNSNRAKTTKPSALQRSSVSGRFLAVKNALKAMKVDNISMEQAREAVTALKKK